MPSTARVKSGSRRHSTTTRWPCNAQSSWAVLSAIAPPPTTFIPGSPGSSTAGPSALRIGRVGVLLPGIVFNAPLAGFPSPANRGRGDRHLAVASGDIEDIGWLAQPGYAAAQRT